MALIPGTLPNDTCYGTPQDLLELFAQYLDVPAFALNSKVVFGTSSAGLTADVVWFDTTVPTNPILKITVSGGFTDYIKNYITSAATVTIVGADTVLILDASDSGNTKKGLVSDIAALAVPAAGSVTFPMLSTSATEADNAAKRVAKAWVNFNGTGTVAIRDDFNVSSITDNGTGQYTINFSSSLVSANYTSALASFNNGANTTGYVCCLIGTQASGSLPIQTMISNNNTIADSDVVNAIILL
jgi:hypothetical protein